MVIYVTALKPLLCSFHLEMAVRIQVASRSQLRSQDCGRGIGISERANATLLYGGTWMDQRYAQKIHSKLETVLNVTTLALASHGKAPT